MTVLGKTLNTIFGVSAILATGIVLDDPVGAEKDHGRQCLALVGFAEARGEGDIGMAAAMQTVLNRVSDPAQRWGDSICAVVQQPGQFIGVEGWSYPRHPELSDLAAWQRAQDMADALIAGTGPELGACRGATSFDQGGAGPELRQICRLGLHFFYVDSVEIAKK